MLISDCPIILEGASCIPTRGNARLCEDSHGLPRNKECAFCGADSRVLRRMSRPLRNGGDCALPRSDALRRRSVR